MKNTKNGLDLQEASDANIDGDFIMMTLDVEKCHEEALKMNSFCDEFDAEHQNDDIVKDWAYASLLNAQIDLWADAAKPTIHS